MMGRLLASCFPCLDANSNNTTLSNESAIQEKSNTDLSPSISQHQKVPWFNVEEKHLMQILSYVNYSDLLQCRLVNQYFLQTISKSELFINSTIFFTSLKPDAISDPSLLAESTVAFQNTRFESIDHDIFIHLKVEDYGAENPTFHPPTGFLSNLKSISFQNSYITWETVKRIINQTPKLERLSIIKCHFVQKYTPLVPLGEFDEFRVGRTFSNLKYFKIIQTHQLSALNKLLEKLIGYCSQDLQQFFITFDPESNSNSNTLSPDEADMASFCNLIRTIIEANIPVMQKLCIDLKYQPLLNMFIPSVFGKMNNLWGELNLEEFLLSPPGCSPTPTDIEISLHCNSSAQTLIGFLESQTSLKKASLPHFRNMGEQHYKLKIGQSFGPSVECLCLPNQEYLPPDFLSKYPSLKKLYIGSSTGYNLRPVPLRSNMFDQLQNSVHIRPAGLPLHLQLNLALSGSSYTLCPNHNQNQEMWDKFRELSIGSTIINGFELMKIIKKFHFLRKFEVTSSLPVMQDEDLHCVVEGMPWLQWINITACDFLTDFGVTGILRNSCEMMVRFNNYHDLEDSSKLESSMSLSNHGRPLSQLKGLQSLLLMGKSQISDVGIHFGLRFHELQTAYLPYNKNVTEWGIKKFADHNPSLQVFVMCSVNKESKKGFLHLKQNHPRVRKNKCEFLNYVDDPSISNNDTDDSKNANADSSAMCGICYTSNFPWWLGGSSGGGSGNGSIEKRTKEEDNPKDHDDKFQAGSSTMGAGSTTTIRDVEPPTLPVDDVDTDSDATKVKVEVERNVESIKSLSSGNKAKGSNRRSIVWKMDQDAKDNNA